MRDLCDLSYTLQRDLIEARVANARIAAVTAMAAGGTVEQVPDADEQIAEFDRRLRDVPQMDDSQRRHLLKALGLR